MGIGLDRRRNDRFPIGVAQTVGDIIGHRAIENGRFSAHHVDLGAQRFEGKFANVTTIDQDLATGRIVQTQQQACNDAVATAPIPHNAQRFAWIQSEIDLFQPCLQTRTACLAKYS